MKILIVGINKDYHIGRYLYDAAIDSGYAASFQSIETAYSTNSFVNSLYWKYSESKYFRLKKFNSDLTERCKVISPDFVLIAGIAPVLKETVQFIRNQGVPAAIYLTDDPFNPSHHRKWVVDSLQYYSCVFNPREDNRGDLINAGCKKIIFLPFGYSDSMHRPIVYSDEFESDMVFLGHADRGRAALFRSLIESGFSMKIYGGGWRASLLRKYRIPFENYCGHAYGENYMEAVSKSKISLCLLRHGNRDCHTMRTFELAKMGACMLVEDSDFHRKIFGEKDFFSVAYFSDAVSAVEKGRRLVQDDLLRMGMAQRVSETMINSKHSYKERLQEMLNALRGIKCL